MGVEIERKYLVNPAKWIYEEKEDGRVIEQGYIVNTPGKIVRVRIYGEKGFITFKGITKGMSRPEFEYEIPVSDARELINKFCASIVKKVRHRVVFNGKVWEVDEFLGENKGLLMAEIELGFEDEVFDCPEWIEKEVTGNTKYYNSYLSLHPFTSWNQKL